MDGVFTVTAAAKRKGVSRHAILRGIYCGDLKATKKTNAFGVEYHEIIASDLAGWTPRSPGPIPGKRYARLEAARKQRRIGRPRGSKKAVKS